jgi:hypothetical protein
MDKTPYTPGTHSAQRPLAARRRDRLRYWAFTSIMPK